MKYAPGVAWLTLHTHQHALDGLYLIEEHNLRSGLDSPLAVPRGLRFLAHSVEIRR